MDKRKYISSAELKTLLLSKNNLMLLDVRSPEEFATAHLPLSQNYPLDQLEQDIFVPPADRFIITICNTGAGRSEKAALYIRSRFGNNALYLEGGVKGWYNLP